MWYSVVRFGGAPVSLGSNAFLGAAAARLCSDSPASLVSRVPRALPLPARCGTQVRLETPGNLGGDRCSTSGTPFRQEAPAWLRSASPPKATLRLGQHAIHR